MKSKNKYNATSKNGLRIGILLLLGIGFTATLFASSLDLPRTTSTDLHGEIKTSGWYEEPGVSVVINTSDTDDSNDWEDYDANYSWCFKEEGYWIIQNISLTSNNIVIESDSPCIIRNSLITDTVDSPSIQISNTNNVTLLNNTVENSSNVGIAILSCNNVSISEGRMINITGMNSGIYMTQCGSVNLIHNYFENHSNYGVYMVGCSYLTVKNSTFYTVNSPILFSGGNYIEILNNTISQCVDYKNYVPGDLTHMGWGIYGGNANDVLIANNTVSSSISGILIMSGFRNKIINNSIMKSHEAGISLRNGNNFTILKNRLYGNDTITIMDSGTRAIFNFTITNGSNYVNNKPVLFFKNEINLNPSNFTGAGEIILVNCTRSLLDEVNAPVHGYYCNDSIISNNDLPYYDFALWLEHCYNISITDNFLKGNTYGIYSASGGNKTLSENSIYSNYYPVYISRESNLLIDNNTIVNTKVDPRLGPMSLPKSIQILSASNIDVSNNKVMDSDGYGISTEKDLMSSILCENITIYNNRLLNLSKKGLSLIEIQNCTVWNNLIKNNPEGCFVDGEDILLYGNSFINNDLNARDLSPVANSWNNSLIGNYWDDYNGTDTDKDGIGDTLTPYNISGMADSKDHLPIFSEPIPPNVTINLPEDKTYNSSNLVINATVTGEFIVEVIAEINGVPRVDLVNTTDNFWINDTYSFPEGWNIVRITAKNKFGYKKNTETAIFHVNTEAPTWDEDPQDRLVELGNSLLYNLNASDLQTVYYRVNDTDNFHIDSTGILTNITELTVGTYYLDLNASDGVNDNLINISIIVEDTMAPTWDHTIDEQTLVLPGPFAYDINTTDFSEIDTYWLNKSSPFVINATTGVITNDTILSEGTYWIEIFVNDSYGNTRSAPLKISVQTPVSPSGGGQPDPFILIAIIGAVAGIGGAGAVVGGVIFKKRRASRPQKPKTNKPPEKDKKDYTYRSYEE